MNYTKVILKPGKEESLKRFHPWVFSGAIHHFENNRKKVILSKLQIIKETSLL